MTKLSVGARDLVEVYNDDGATQTMVYPTPVAKKGHTFMLFAFPTGMQGNVVNADTYEVFLPNYKKTWANIGKLASSPQSAKHSSFRRKNTRWPNHIEAIQSEIASPDWCGRGC